MAQDKTFVICHCNGNLITSGGRYLYQGGQAQLVSVTRDKKFADLLREIADAFNVDQNVISIRYALPANEKEILISVSNDNGLQQMVDFYGNFKTIMAYISVEETRGGPQNDEITAVSSREVASNVEENIDSRFEHSSSAILHEKDTLAVGEDFKDVYEFRMVLRNYAIKNNFAYQYVQNHKQRVVVRCKAEGCSWSLHASSVSRLPVFRIKKLNSDHTCEGSSVMKAHPQATQYWVAEAILDKLRETPQIKPKEIIDELHREHGITLSYWKAWRGKEAAMEKFMGSYAKAYNMLSCYCEKVKETNPGSVAAVSTDDKGRFQRLFISYAASRNGFRYCRPLIFLHGISLEGKYHGQLITATAVDGNNSMFPIGYGIVESENGESWRWLLTQLREALDTDCRLTFISDGQKGFTKSIEEVFPYGYHAYSLCHLVESFRHDMRSCAWSSEMKDTLVSKLLVAARTFDVQEFENHVHDIKAVAPEAAEWISTSDPSHWSNAFFRGSRYNFYDLDIVERSNTWMRDGCALPILKMMEELRRRLMEQMHRCLQASKNWETKLTPSMETELTNDMEKSRDFRVFCSSDNVFEVIAEKTYVVDFANSACSCYTWQAYGLPCEHALAVISFRNESPYDYCLPYFTTLYYQSAYSCPINPIPDLPGLDFDNKSSGEDDLLPNPIYPPDTKRQVGRPRKKQVLDGELNKRPLHCSICNEAGHNRKTCKMPV